MMFLFRMFKCERGSDMSIYRLTGTVQPLYNKMSKSEIHYWTIYQLKYDLKSASETIQ